eukprot:188638-Prymnesium_polylepis.1
MPQSRAGDFSAQLPRKARAARRTPVPSWPMADDVARGGIGSLRAPCGVSGTRYVSMRGLIGSRRVPST